MEELTLSEVAGRLADVSKAVGEGVDFNNAFTVAAFFRDFEDTNQVVKCAERDIDEDAEKAVVVSQEILSLVDSINQLDLSAWQSADYEKIFDEHIKAWKDRWEALRDVATGLWREYQRLSNQIDFMPYEDERFEPLSATCDRARDEYYKVAKPRADKAFTEMKAEERRLLCLYFFRWSQLDVLLDKLKAIAETVVKVVEKGDGV